MPLNHENTKSHKIIMPQKHETPQKKNLVRLSVLEI